MRYDFQLNVAKEDEHAIAEQITALKGQGRYSKTVRDGIRLVSDLNAGSLDTLFELFPWVRADFLEYMTAVQPQKSDTETHIQKQLARIEALLANGETMTPTSKSTGGIGGPKAMRVPAITAPVFDDDDKDMLVISKAASSSNATQNFLNSISRLQ
jgi:hypothetical protein